jgi:transcriptional regulator with XRE-family HTH domain
LLGRKSSFYRSAALRRKLTQEALAYDCGINRTYLSAVERAECNVSIDNIARIAKGLQVEPWKLLKDD